MPAVFSMSPLRRGFADALAEIRHSIFEAFTSALVLFRLETIPDGILPPSKNFVDQWQIETNLDGL